MSTFQFHINCWIPCCVVCINIINWSWKQDWTFNDSKRCDDKKFASSRLPAAHRTLPVSSPWRNQIQFQDNWKREKLMKEKLFTFTISISCGIFLCLSPSLAHCGLWIFAFVTSNSGANNAKKKWERRKGKETFFRFTLNVYEKLFFFWWTFRFSLICE